MHRHFDEQIAALNQQLLLMSGHAESIIRKAVEALMRRDPALADQVFADDKLIDRMEIDIEEACIQLLALQQPLARDLRLITSALKISNDLERVGDHAVNIAGCAKELVGKPPVRPLADLPELSDKATAMLRDALDAFVRRDPEAARLLVRRDDEVDDLHRRMFADLMGRMIADPQQVDRSMTFVLVGRNLERIGDLATNIAEEVVFIAEARIIKHHADEGLGEFDRT
ncbi:MAG: phosphate signaling complex protein PhoU [Candidatus Eisenbacteria bacterium]|jgi:phosphate transport system protein